MILVFQFEVISKAVFQFRTISFTRIQPKKVKSEYGSGFSSFLFPAWIFFMFFLQLL